jgi:hypothetical protein
MEVSGEIHAPVALSEGKSLRYLLDVRVGGWVPEPVWAIWIKYKKVLPLPGMELLPSNP